MSSIRSVPRPEVAPSSVASAWLLVALWTALVWWLGSDLFGAGTTSRLLGPLLDWLIPGLPPDRRFAILMTIRKIAHPSIYAVLAGLAFRASLLSGVSGLVRGAAIALAMAISVAGLDEWRQTQTRTRTGAASDVALDAAGASAALAALGFARRRGRLGAAAESERGAR